MLVFPHPIIYLHHSMFVNQSKYIINKTKLGKQTKTIHDQCHRNRQALGYTLALYIKSQKLV